MTLFYNYIRVLQPHWLYSSRYDVLQRFSDDWFIVFTPKSLGELQFIHIWHNSFGNYPNWYCKYIEVICVRDNKKWNFNVERWLSLMQNVENSEQIVFVGSPRDWIMEAYDIMGWTIRDEYSWANIFIR